MSIPDNLMIDDTKPIYVFWHVFIDKERFERAINIIKRQFDKLEKSGLLERCNTLYIGYVSTLDFPFDYIINHSKVKFIVKKDIGYEGVTTTAMKEFCDIQDTNSLIMYIHTRGISQHENSPSEDWTLMMEYFVIERWRESIKMLKDKYTCGCELWGHFDRIKGTDIIYHYSGNFWWSRSEYIKMLGFPVIYEKGSEVYQRLGSHAVNCLESEDWILQLVDHGISREYFGVLHRTSKEEYDIGQVHSYIDRYGKEYYKSGNVLPDIVIDENIFHGKGCRGK